jgi:hypothetical protein
VSLLVTEHCVSELEQNLEKEKIPVSHAYFYTLLKRMNY